MALKVIGAGYGRTGTLSLKRALDRLKFGPCYHMVETMANPAHDAVWHAATKGEDVDWERLLEGFTSAVDWPVSAFWWELAQLYPESKIILSVRDPEAWCRSISRTIFELLDHTPLPPKARAHREMTRALIRDRVFGGNIRDPSHIIAVYQRHIQAVRDRVPPERLLVYRIGDGWGPLCTFLGCPLPESPFPYHNTHGDFHEMMRSWEREST